jgi:hypothetical protein
MLVESCSGEIREAAGAIEWRIDQDSILKLPDIGEWHRANKMARNNELRDILDILVTNFGGGLKSVSLIGIHTITGSRMAISHFEPPPISNFRAVAYKEKSLIFQCLER